MGAVLACNEGHDDGVEEIGTSTTEWGFVGNGRGQYVKVPTYVFVGQGHGDFEFEEQGQMEESNHAHRFSCFTTPTGGMGIPCLVAMLVLAIVVVGVASAIHLDDDDDDNKSTKKLRATIVGAADARHSDLQLSKFALPRYVCGADAGIDSASDALNVFDTDHDGRVSAEELHDCAHGNVSSVEGADRVDGADGGGVCALQKLARKLEDAQVAGEGKAPLQYDGLVTALAKVAAQDISSWSSAKKYWCCDNANVACPAPLPVSTPTQGQVVALAPNLVVPAGSEPFDCSAGFNDWWRSWSQTKMDWCCTTYKRGCASGKPSAPPSVTATALQAPPPVVVVTLPPC